MNIRYLKVESERYVGFENDGRKAKRLDTLTHN